MEKCPVSGYCGGCRYQGIGYPEQLEKKQKRLEKLLSSFCAVEDIIGMADPLHYRNRMQISCGYDDSHRPVSGYYLPSSHMILPVDDCMICDDKLNRIVRSVKKILSRYRIPFFDERSMKGCLRHILVKGTNRDEYMVVLVTGSMILHDQKQIVKEIIRNEPEVKTIVRNINTRRTSAILGDRNEVLYGKGYITDELCGLKFRISAGSFYQVNKRQTAILYDKAIEMADLRKDEILIDAYCGTGTIGLCAADKVRKVIGVESNRSAVKDAETNRKINDIDNAEFVCDDAGRYMDRLRKEGTHIDAVIMDPPRSGSDIRFMSSMTAMKPEKIVYVSCNPETLKDDLKYLTKHYDVKKIQPVDMFPYTDHVETIVLLQKTNSEQAFETRRADEV